MSGRSEEERRKNPKCYLQRVREGCEGASSRLGRFSVNDEISGKEWIERIVRWDRRSAAWGGDLMEGKGRKEGLVSERVLEGDKAGIK